MPVLPLSRRRALTLLAALPAAGLLPGAARAATRPTFDAESFQLDNGLEVVVATNRRVPIVTQMLWYKVGQADEAPGKSGLAHFLEHLMFKGTTNAAPGEFSAVVASNGGRENAFTSRDYTGYYQTAAADRLEILLRYEADRMANLVLTDALVDPEREVILEERRQRTDNEPSQQLDEAATRALFQEHPYGIPVIGWEHEMRGLTTEDARAFYRRWYAPNNAVLVIGGDVMAEDVQPLVEKHYGPIPAKELPKRWRPSEPEPLAARRATLASPLVQQPQLTRAYLVARRSDLVPEEAAELLGVLLGGGATSRLYRRLVVEQGLAAAAGAYAMSDVLDYVTFQIYALPRSGTSLADLEQALDAEIARLLEEGAGETELREAKDRLQAEAVFARDDPTTAPRIIGRALTLGQTLETVQTWNERVEAVTAADVTKLAASFLKPERSVTGELLPKEPA